MKNNNIIRPTGLKGNEKLNRMRNLMGMAPINESTGNSVLELTKKGPDGKVYGIVRENHKYYIKTTDKTNGEMIAEDFNYIGGLKNKNSVVFESYAKAIKQLNLKFISLNEALGKDDSINTFKNDILTEDCDGPFSEQPKPSQPDALMGTVKEPGKNDGHEEEIISDAGETGNPDVDTPPVVEEEEVIDEDADAVELTEGEKLIDRILKESMASKKEVVTESVEEETVDIVAERKLSIGVALQKIDEGVNSQKKKK